MQYTPERRRDLEAYLASHDLSVGVGNKESACTVAAINIAMTGEVKDTPIDCMSLVLHLAVIPLQDVMPADLRNSQRYKDLIPHMPGTGRDREQERAGVILEWMWETALPQLQPLADDKGFGAEWRKMLDERTPAAADAAADAADAAADAAYADRAAAMAARAAVYADDPTYVADAAVYAARSADRASADSGAFWTAVDPIGVLERMTFLGEPV
jgi:hypothetical protein